MHAQSLRNRFDVLALALPVSGRQFLPVSGLISDRLFVTYRADARRLRALVPAPFQLDEYEGYGFVSVCAVEILGMGIVGTPRWLRFDNREFLYRVAVKLEHESTFITLRSHVSSRALAFLGKYFSHYRPLRAQVSLARTGERLKLTCVTSDQSGDAELEADLQAPIDSTSVFGDAESAATRLLGMQFSADADAGRALVQRIEHTPWQPRFVPTPVARFAFIEALGRELGVHFELDGTLAVHGIQQTWCATRWR